MFAMIKQITATLQMDNNDFITLGVSFS